MKTSRGTWLLVVALADLTGVAAGQGTTRSELRSLEVAEHEGVTVVTLEVTGTCPLPTAHWLDDPPRIYLDLAGVRPRVGGPTRARGAGAVTRVRVALKAADPAVTRVVLDLARRESFRVSRDERLAGRLSIFVAPEAALMRPESATPGEAMPTPAAPPLAQLPVPPGEAVPTAVAPPVAPVPASGAPRAAGDTPPPSGPGGSAPAGDASAVPGHGQVTSTPSAPLSARTVTRPQAPQAAVPRLPARDVDRYRRQVSGALERIEAHRAVLAAIDADESVDAETLSLAAAGLTNLRRLLGDVTPSMVMASTHDLLIASCTLGATAANLRLQAGNGGSVEARRNAASAAAGALMVLDRVWASLGLAAPSR